MATNADLDSLATEVDSVGLVAEARSVAGAVVTFWNAIGPLPWPVRVVAMVRYIDRAFIMQDAWPVIDDDFDEDDE